MLLFSRRRTFNPARTRAAIGFAVEVGGRVTQVTGHDISVWTTAFSPEANTIMWSVRVDRMSELAMANDKMAADTSLGDMIEQNDEMFVGPTTDSLVSVVAGTPDPAPMPYVQIVQAICAPSKLSAGMAFGAEVAELVTRVTGRSCLFGASATGPWGGVGWITGAPDADAVQDANDAFQSSADAIAMMDKAGEFFLPGAQTTILRRLN